MYGYVYKTVNNINDKIYVGSHQSTKTNEDARFTLKNAGWSDITIDEFFLDFRLGHGFDFVPVDPNYIGSGSELLKDVNKYGKHNFYVIDILDVADTREELKRKEWEWIVHYMFCLKVPMYNVSTRTKTGYDREKLKANGTYQNIVEGNRRRFKGWKEQFGGYKTPKGKITLPSTRDKISKANKGRIQSEEERSMRRAAHPADVIPPNMKGNYQITDGLVNKYISPDEASKYLDIGWVRGSTHLVKMIKGEDRCKIRMSEVPYYLDDGWVVDPKVTSKAWINNEHSQIYIRHIDLSKYLEEGWKLGRIISKEV